MRAEVCGFAFKLLGMGHGVQFAALTSRKPKERNLKVLSCKPLSNAGLESPIPAERAE